MKDILVLMHDDEGQEARLQAALDITRAVEGHLSCVDVAIMPMVIGDFYSGAGEAALLEDERTREAVNRRAVEARLEHEQVSWSWVDATGAIIPCLDDEAGLADLVVVNRQLDGFPAPDMRSVVGEMLVKSGRPILAVPDASRGFDVCGKALVAWDGSPASAAALRAAIPLLKLAQSVILYEVDDGSIATPVEDAAVYLSRYDIHALIRRDPAHGKKPADLIQPAIHRYAADYVVMGGFSHSRFVEAIFGGVTRSMLTDSPVPVFLAR